MLLKLDWINLLQYIHISYIFIFRQVCTHKKLLAWASSVWWLITIPFGNPVVPLLKNITAGSSVVFTGRGKNFSSSSWGRRKSSNFLCLSEFPKTIMSTFNPKISKLLLSYSYS